MKKDVLELLLQTESEYHDAMRTAVWNAEKYVDDRRKTQREFIADLKRSIDLFEQAEAERLEETLALECYKMEQESDRRKEKMRALKEESADRIARSLKEEVLTELWQ